MTRLLLTKVPFFREIILMSFYCEHCHFSNTEVQTATEIQPQGSKYTFKLERTEDLQRQIVKSDSSILRIEDLDIEVPAGKGRLTNVEGVLKDVLQDLVAGQAEREKSHPDTYEKLQTVIKALESLISDTNFTMTLDDPAGNSWIEPAPANGDAHEKYSIKHYARSLAQNASLGLAASAPDSKPQDGTLEAVAQVEGGMEDVDILEGQTYELPVLCPGCTTSARLLLQMVNIPHFKQVVISTTECSACGYRVTDVKTGGEIPEKGKRIILDVKGPEDMKRDILKSETCMMKIPECKVEVVPGTMGGRFTTVEGLVSQIRDDLRSSIFDADESSAPDSMPGEVKKAWQEFFAQLDKAIAGEVPYTIILEDPLAGSYCQSIGAPEEDHQLTEEEYERTEEEEEELGLADMKTHLNEEGEYVKEPATAPSGALPDAPPDAPATAPSS